MVDRITLNPHTQLQLPNLGPGQSFPPSGQSPPPPTLLTSVLAVIGTTKAFLPPRSDFPVFNREPRVIVLSSSRRYTNPALNSPSPSLLPLPLVSPSRKSEWPDSILTTGSPPPNPSISIHPLKRHLPRNKDNSIVCVYFRVTLLCRL